MSISESRDYFEGVSTAVAALEAARGRLETMRRREGVRAQTYGGIRSGGTHDPMAATDARMDAEGFLTSEVARCESVIRDGYAVLDELGRANTKHHEWPLLLELKYFQRLPWDAVAASMGMSRSSAYAYARAAMDWMDAHGLVNGSENYAKAV